MRILAASFLLALLSFTMACPAPAPVTPVDASDAAQEYTVTTSVNALACQNLRAHNCSEGFAADGGDTCEAIFDREDRLHNFQFHAQCVADAKTVDVIRACGPSTPCVQATASFKALVPVIESFGVWDKSGTPPRVANDGGCDERCQHDRAVRDMERLMNSGF